MLVSVQNLTKRFRVYPRPRFWLYEKLSFEKKIYHIEVSALKDISFELSKGETLALIGKNGAGKSSLLRLLAGISYPDSGKIELQGKVGALLELGSGFHPEFIGRENLKLNGMIAGFSARELKNKIEEMIEFSELGSFIELPVRTYSDGMCLRLGFSLAQALEPDLFLIDEALAVGDEYFRGKCLRRMLELKEKGTAMVIASHDLTMVRGLCSKAIYLKQGEIQRMGPASEVVECYLEDIYLEAMGKKAFELSAPDKDWKRRGTGDARIIAVRMRNQSGKESDFFITGEELEIEFEYYSGQEVKEPLFGVNIFRSDGVLVISTNQECALFSGAEYNQRVENQLGRAIPGEHKGRVSYRFKNLLVPGRYQLSVNIFKGRSGACIPVDEVFDVIRFEVGVGRVIDRGVFINSASWRIS